MGIIDYAGKGTVKALWERMKGFVQENNEQLTKEVDNKIESTVTQYAATGVYFEKEKDAEDGGQKADTGE